MTEEQVHQMYLRIDKVVPNQKPLFGTMNANQMICHCTDQLRLAIGSIRALEYGNYEAKQIIALSKAGRTIPVPKGLGQVEGGGTKPTHFENDKKTLKEHLLRFSILPDNFQFGEHPYFGKINKERWDKITQFHVDHHLKQFNV